MVVVGAGIKEKRLYHVISLQKSAALLRELIGGQVGVGKGIGKSGGAKVGIHGDGLGEKRLHDLQSFLPLYLVHTQRVLPGFPQGGLFLKHGIAVKNDNSDKQRDNNYR